MKTVIDELRNASGWSIAPPASGTITATAWPFGLSASFIPGQLEFAFSAAGVASKDFAPVSLGSEISFALSVYSSTDEADFGTSGTTPEPTTYRAKIRFIDTVNVRTLEYFLPLKRRPMHQVQFDLGGMVAIDRIEIEALEPVSFFASELIAFYDEFPIDVYRAVQQLIEIERDKEPELSAGVVTASPGDNQIVIRGASYVDKYASIRIGSEIHFIAEAEERENTGDLLCTLSNDYFTGLASGGTIVGSYTDEPVTLYIPVNIEPGEEDSQWPSIALSGAFDTIAGSRDPGHIIDSYTTTPGSETVRTRPKSNNWTFMITISGEARHGKVIESISRILRKALGVDAVIWVNGRQHDIFTESVNQIDFGDATEILGKIEAISTVSAAEDNPDFEIQPVGLTVTLDVGPRPIT